MDIERWVSVIGYEGFYEVSNFGRIRSLDRISFSNKRTLAFGFFFLKLLIIFN
jgi:hypothetical protein